MVGSRQHVRTHQELWRHMSVFHPLTPSPMSMLKVGVGVEDWSRAPTLARLVAIDVLFNIDIKGEYVWNLPGKAAQHRNTRTCSQCAFDLALVRRTFHIKLHGRGNRKT